MTVAIRLIQVVLLAALLTAGTAQAEATTSIVSEVFTRAVLTMVKLQSWKQVQEGTLSPALLTCVESLEVSSFTAVFDEILAGQLDQNELATATIFFTSDIGKKTERFSRVKMYSDVGAALPELFPTYTEAEYKEMDDFKKSSVGKKLLIDKILDSDIAQEKFSARMVELTKPCIESRQ